MGLRAGSNDLFYDALEVLGRRRPACVVYSDHQEDEVRLAFSNPLVDVLQNLGGIPSPMALMAVLTNGSQIRRRRVFWNIEPPIPWLRRIPDKLDLVSCFLEALEESLAVTKFKRHIPSRVIRVTGRNGITHAKDAQGFGGGVFLLHAVDASEGATEEFVSLAVAIDIGSHKRPNPLLISYLDALDETFFAERLTKVHDRRHEKQRSEGQES